MLSKTRLAVLSFSAAAALGFWLQAASATTLYDNISATPGGFPYQAAPFSLSNPGNSGPLYNSFSTLGSTFSLSQFDLLIGASNPSDGGGFGFSILSDSISTPGTPGTAFYTSGLFSDSFIPTANTPTDVNFSFATQTLAASSRYWIELFATGSVNWYWSYDTSGTGVSGEYWAFTEENGNIGVGTVGPFQMLVTADAAGITPLPAAFPLFATGLGALGLLGWRRKRKNASAIAA